MGVVAYSVARRRSEIGIRMARGVRSYSARSFAREWRPSFLA
jgi:hypothetical protein